MRSPRQQLGEPTDSAAVKAPKTGSQGEQVDELVRILNARPQRFRLQFFTVASDRGPAIVHEIALDATDLESAARVAAGSQWPQDAIGLRIVDEDGRELFEQLKADRR